MVISFSATAFVGFHSVVVVVVGFVVVEPVDVEAVLVEPDFFDEPWPFAVVVVVVVVDLGPFVFVVLADLVEGPLVVCEEPFVDGPFVVVVVVFVVVLGEFALAFVFGAASALSARAAAAMNAAGSAIHLVITPPSEQSSKGCTPVPIWD